MIKLKEIFRIPSIREFLVVFLSIVLAFLFEDLRENLNGRSEYKEVLIIFASDLSEEMYSMKAKIDSSYLEDLPWSGSDFAELQNLHWIDSLMKNASLRKWHLMFLLDRYYIGSETRRIYDISSLASEIRNKHNEYASRRFIRKELRVYETQMKYLDALSEQIHSAREQLNLQLSKLNLLDETINLDSEVVITSEFKWYFKEYLKLKEEEYLFKDYLVHNRLVFVSKGVKQELDNLHFIMGYSHRCFDITSLVERYECEEGKKPVAKPIPIKDLLTKNRIKYYEKLKSHGIH